MEYPWDFSDAESKVNQVKMTGIAVVLKTQTAVDDTRLRKRQTDILPRLLDILKHEEKKLPVLELVANETR